MELDYLVTGGAGFIGCALAAELTHGATDVGESSIVAVDSLHPQVHRDHARPAALPKSVDLRVMDICDADGWDRILAVFRPANIIHLAAETGTGQSLDSPTRHTHVNVTGTALMLEALDRANHRPKHIVLASSRAVYGEGRWVDPVDGHIFVPGHRPIEQLERGQFAVIAPSGVPAKPLPHDQAEMTPSPASVYGVTKLAQEQVLSLWCDARHVPLSILRLQNVYGAGQSPHNPYTGIVGLFHRVAAAGSSIEVYEDGLIGRDFIYIDDVARCIASALRTPPPVRRVRDVGSGTAITILDVARSIAEFYRAPQPWVSGAFRHGDVRWAVAATDDLMTDLGFAAKIDFSEGNKRLSEWLGAHGQSDLR